MTSELRVDRIIPTTGVPTGGGGSIVQVVQNVVTSSSTGTAGTPASVMTCSITPRALTNKILIMIDANVGSSNGYGTLASLYRGTGGSGVQLYFGDEDNNHTESTVPSTQNMNDAQINHSPASANDVLDALRREMRQTRQESELLRAELSQTKTKITKLEYELDEKTSELQSIQELSQEMEKIITETNLSGEKSLSLMDSVMVGDALFNGDKIDRQIFNDPNAIARAAIEAYKEGQKDKELLDFDF